ncbi:glycosyltransferase [Microbacterium tenebrionis]|uniref:glycosyltransferase n=1 Tax=Microbacterium tenebrionis TaxID=2830665 RepID=UPI00158F5CC5|nr:glycosyltransferase [Microbacterium ihumii]
MTSEPGRGAIVLAAYSPDPELFRAQLRSLQDQSIREWECIVSVDGERDAVESLVSDIVGGDERFRVVGDGSRRGFYHNFEYGLRAVSEDAAWIALCDQDDRWEPNKIAALLPHLKEVSLVSGQARLVRYPSGEITGVTDRGDHGAILTLLSNQFTGSLCVLDAAILATALPFPVVSSRVATHDHWLAVVAGAYRGTRIVDDVVQDYVQHDANVFGDPSRLENAGLAASVRNVLSLAQRYEGSRSPLSLMRMTFWTYVGWRQVMVDTLRSRTGLPDERIEAAFGAGRRWPALNTLLRRAARSGVVPARFVLEYRASWLAGLLSGGREAARHAAHRSP